MLPFLIGCGSSDYPETVEVHGQLTLDGKPVPEAIVTFMPSEGQRSATGYTDSNGEFAMTTFEEGDGAVPGSHRVAVNSTTPPPMPGELPVMGEKAGPKKYTPPFPAKYSNPDKSGFTVDITRDGENEVTFEMKSRG